MKKGRITHIVTLVSVTILFLLGAVVITAQDNLLTNPGFEDSFRTVSGDQPRSVAQGWTPYHIARTGDMPSFQNTQPKYIASSAANSEGIQPRIRSGNDAQIYYSFFETHDGAVY
jgi:hypothetical protein